MFDLSRIPDKITFYECTELLQYKNDFSFEMQGRLNVNLSQENPLWISWHDTNWIPILNPTNVMDYFSEKTNPFYDRTCNNEIIKMQRQSLDQLK